MAEMKPDKPVLVDTGLPGWLQPYKQDRGLVHTEVTVEKALQMVALGTTLREICEENKDMPEAKFLRAWIMKNPEWKRRYYEAKAIGADAKEDLIQEIADGTNSMEDVQRSQLRVNTMFRLLTVWNRERYSEKQDNAVNVNIDLGKAMEAGMARAEAARRSVTIEGEYDDEQ